MTPLNQQILRTILYYDIFSHPLTLQELYLFLPQNSITKSELSNALLSDRDLPFLRYHNGHFFLHTSDEAIVKMRSARENLARKRWYIAKLFSHLIKRFPFVRGVFVSGDLSKSVALPESDIDYVIITASKRLWICRTLLILFKKIFLLNQKKYFCLNYFVTVDHLETEDKNYFTATEIAHMKPLCNFPLFLNFINANSWIKKYFPNYLLFRNQVHECTSTRSILQRFMEIPFSGTWADRVDLRLMDLWEKTWKRRYPQLSDNEREFRFRCSPTESRAFGQELGSKILALYNEKLSQFGLQPPQQMNSRLTDG